MSCKESYPDLASNQALYKAARWVLIRDFDFPKSTAPEDATAFEINYDPKDGFGPWSSPKPDHEKRRRLLRLASVVGVLLSRHQDDPSYGRIDINSSVTRAVDIDVVQSDGTVTRRPLVIVSQFIADVADAVKTYNQAQELFQNVYHQLYEEGTNGLSNQLGANPTTVVRTRQLADVTKRLVDDGISPSDPHLFRQIVLALGRDLSSRSDGNTAALDIDLPDLDAGTAVDIESDNVAAVAAIYFSSQLEEMKLHAVADAVADHFMTGMLPLSRSRDGERIYEWIKEARNRFTEVERRSIYGRVLGLAQGNAGDVLPNREFADLWIRFLSTVSLLARDALTTNTRKVTNEQAHKAARDLAVNLSLHGYGVAHFAAIEMQSVVREVKEMLEAPAVMRAYGVNDVWQLVDRVSGIYLGGAMNGVRYRTMAQNGANIILWLSRMAPKLASTASGGGIDFTAPELVNLVEGWLAVTGTPDSTVERYTDPVAISSQPTIPSLGLGNSLSSTVKDALSQIGVSSLPNIPQA